MSGINKAGSSPLLSQMPSVTAPAVTPTQNNVVPLPTQSVNSQSTQWSQFAQTPQNFSFQNEQLGQIPGTEIKSVLRQQMYNHVQTGAQSNPFDSQSWQTTGNIQFDQAIDRVVDKMFFDPKEGLGLPAEGLGYRRRSGMSQELNLHTSGGNLAADPRQAYKPLMRVYGTTGQTLGEVGVAALNKQTGFFNVTDDGGIVSGHGQITALAARARAYGGIDPNAMAAEFGVEANATLLDLQGGFTQNSQLLDLGFLKVGHETKVDARLYAGADAYAEARVSFENGPRVGLSAGAFAGASAELYGSETIKINGKTVASGHAGVKAWAGAGAKVDIDVGFQDGKLDFRFDVGAALGVGLEIDFGFSIDFKAAAAVVKDTIKSVLGKLLPFANSGAQMSPDFQQALMLQILQQVQESLRKHNEAMAESAKIAEAA